MHSPCFIHARFIECCAALPPAVLPPLTEDDLKAPIAPTDPQWLLEHKGRYMVNLETLAQLDAILATATDPAESGPVKVSRAQTLASLKISPVLATSARTVFMQHQAMMQQQAAQQQQAVQQHQQQQQQQQAVQLRMLEQQRTLMQASTTGQVSKQFRHRHGCRCEKEAERVTLPFSPPSVCCLSACCLTAGGDYSRRTAR